MKFLRRLIVRRRAKRALRLLAQMDMAMIRSRYNHQQRKQFWADFIKSPAARLDALGKLYGYYHGWGKPKAIQPAETKES